MLSCVKTVGEPSSTVEYALAILGHYIVCKNLKAQHPLRTKTWFQKKLILVGQNAHPKPCYKWTKVYPTFFAKRRRNHCVKITGSL